MGFLGASDDSTRSANDNRSSTTSSSSSDDATDSVSQNARDTLQQKKSVHNSSDDSESDGESQPLGNSLRNVAEPARNSVAQGTSKTLTQPSSVLASPDSEGEESSDKEEEEEEEEEEKEHMAKSSQKRARQDEDELHTVSKRTKKNEAEAPASALPANPKSSPSTGKRRVKKSVTAAEKEVRSAANEQKSRGKRKRKELQPEPEQEQDNAKSGPPAVSMASPASKKTVPHMWSEEDETTLLKCIIELRKQGINVPPGYGELHEFAAPRLQFRDVDRLQVRAKVGRMKARFERAVDRMEEGSIREEDFKFKNAHEAQLFKLWKQAWGSSEDSAMVDVAANKNSSEPKGKGKGKDKAKDTADLGNDKEKAADLGKDKEKTRDTTEKRKGKDKAKDSAEHVRGKHVDSESKAKVKGKDIEPKDKDNVKVAAQGSGEDAAEKLKDKEKKKITRKGRSKDEEIADQQQQQHTVEALSPPVNSNEDAIGARVEPSEANADRDVVPVPNNINVHGDGNDSLEEDGTTMFSEPELEALSKGRKALEDHASEIEAIGTRVGLMYDELTSFSRRLLLIRQECDKHVKVIRSFTRHEP